MKVFATIALLLVAGHAASAENTYSIYLPKYIRPLANYEFAVEIIQNESPVVVHGTLESKDFKSEVTLTIESGNTEKMMFDQIPADYDGSTDFNITVSGEDSETGETLFSNTTTDIQYQKKFISIFIQTDKAIYQPGHIIKFRAVITTSDLKPFSASGATYKVIDPNSNVVMMEKDAAIESGVVGSEFKLGRYATLGDWKIVYQVYGFEESITVSVEEYKLPKFKVEIKTDQTYLHPGSMELTGEISAMFTFGQPVKGKARVEFTIDRWRRRGVEPEKIKIKYAEFDGSESFKIKASDIEAILKWNPKYYSSPLKITAFVEDKNTGDEFNATAEVKLESVRMKVEAIAKPDHIKPGLPYVAYIKVSEQDGTLLSDKEREDLDMKINVEYTYPWSPLLRWDRQRKPKKETYDVEVGVDGIVELKIVADSGDFQNVNFQVKIDSYPNKNQYWTSWSAEKFKSPSNTFIQVSTDDTSLTVGDMAHLTIYTTENASEYRFSLLARGQLVKQELYTPAAQMGNKFKYEFMVTTEMSPNVFVIVSFIRDDGEIVADSIKINVQAALLNKVTMTTSTEKTDAGKPVSITVQADVGSFVGLRAIDQSVLLLKSGNDITKDKIFQDLDKYGTTNNRQIGWGGGWGRWWWPYPIGGADVSEVFENSGIIVLTDALVYSSKPDYSSWMMFRGGGPPPVAFAMAQGGMVGRGRAESARVIGGADARSLSAPVKRSYFPESWIWADEHTGDDGSTTFTYNTPDTITTWELSSFAVSNNKGLGVTDQNSKITVFRNFFISLNLPPTMIRGEVLLMRTTLFNYFDFDLTVTLTLTSNEWYDLVLTGEESSPVVVVTIPSKDSKTVVYPIRFKKVGTARISVMAQSSMAGDAVERTIVVKPEGIPKVESHSSIIDRKVDDDSTTDVVFDVDIPDDAVEGSVYVKFSVSGNILGNALSNLGNLLKMPSGCGEQTMLSFAPDVYISLYLKKVGELEGEIKQKSKSHIQEGYQNELRYQRSDGSFSAFGSSDRSGSTWLTAFVTKCFVAAKQLNSDLIEDSKIDKAVRFILSNQNEDGTFNEPGRVIHKDMQGGVDSSETTAAYMLIALAEGGMFKKEERVEAAMKKTQTYLESKIDSVRDIYTLSIMAYALALVESAEAGKILAVIDDKATVRANVKYWEKAESGAAKCEGERKYCTLDDKPGSSSIEITAYVLLTYVKMGRMNTVMPIVRWLVEQRGAFGGYQSTQDTVMAIQALSTVAGLFSDRPMDLDLTVTHDGKVDYVETFDLDKENAIVLQMAKLPSVPGMVTVSATGQGFADVQVTVSYNIPIGPRIDEPFVVDVDVKEKYMGQIVVLKVCSKINEERKEVIESTGMFVITATLPSGYTIDDKEATRENKNLKLVELVGDVVTGYFDELTKGKLECMTLNLRRYADVAGVKDQIIDVIDYYHPTIKASRMFSPPGGSVCDLCGEECSGCPPKPPPPPPPPIHDDAVCEEITYPCPNFSDGLYYDSRSHISKMMGRYSKDENCSAPEGAGDSSKFFGLPGSLLNGVDQFVKCSGTPFFDSLVTNREGFTISILVYPTESTKNKLYAIYSIGAKGSKRPYVILSKRPRVDQYWLKMRIHEHEYTVRSIYTYDIPMNKWTMITARLSGSGASGVLQLFINGIEKGKRSKRSKPTEAIQSEVNLKVGRSHIGSRITRGNFVGLVSSLDIWSKPLTDDQIVDHYEFYKAVMNMPNPMLKQNLVHHVVHENLRKCFKQAYSASDLKKRAGDLRTSCDEPNGPKPPQPDLELDLDDIVFADPPQRQPGLVLP